MKTKLKLNQLFLNYFSARAWRICRAGPVLAACLFGLLLTAQGQDPTFTKITTGVIVTDSEGSISGNWADYDGDGYPDLFVANAVLSGSTHNALYYNLHGTNFSRQVPASATLTGDSMRVWGAAWADYDNDGNVDLIVANLDGGVLAQRLYHNNGDGTFTAVIDSELLSDTKSASCPWWFDYDNDGFLDLFMAKGTYLGGAANDCVFRNNGDGTFKKMTAAEVGSLVNDQLRTDSCHSVDYDNDGRQELSLVHPIPLGGGAWDIFNATWRCQEDGTFVAVTPTGLHDSSIIRWWADYDNDGWLDAFCSQPLAIDVWMPQLFHNSGAEGFTNITTALNVTEPINNMGAASWGDYDNDGWIDLFFTGQYSGAPRNGMFRNNRDGTFTQIVVGNLIYDGGRQTVPSWVDINRDGFLDLFIAVGNAEPERNLLYRNNGNANHWLNVKLDGRASNRSGIGAKVRVQATINGQTFWQMREISCENSYAGQNGLLAHFGLGDATSVTTLRIEWPSGIVQEIPNVAPDQFLTVVESQGYTNACPSFTGATQDASGLQLTFTEPEAGTRYVIEASSDLVHWTKLKACTSTGGTAQFTDPVTTNQTQRFYRLQVP